MFCETLESIIGFAPERRLTPPIEVTFMLIRFGASASAGKVPGVGAKVVLPALTFTADNKLKKGDAPLFRLTT